MTQVDVDSFKSEQNESEALKLNALLASAREHREENFQLAAYVNALRRHLDSAEAIHRIAPDNLSREERLRGWARTFLDGMDPADAETLRPWIDEEIEYRT